jgi:L-ascorbate metabolism protein UlaG (beta-lactamase superfamily)
MFIGIIVVVILLLIIIFGIMSLRTPDYYKGPITTHFDGNNFYNPGHYKKNTTLDLFRWWFHRKREEWPKQVDNIPQPPLTAITKPSQLRITFVNHATVLIQTEKLNILTDPVWADRVSPFRFIGPVRVRKPGINFNDLPRIDVILISHNHYDHLDLATLVNLENKFHPLILVPLGNKAFLARYKIDNVVEMDWWDQHAFKSATITFLPSRHWSARWLNDKCRTLWGSFGIEVENKKIYFAGDTGFSLQNFTNIHSRWGAPDVAILPIGSYKPEWFMQQNHMNPKEAVQTHMLLQAKHSIPIHYGTFQLSDEGINEPIIDLEKALLELRISLQEFRPLLEGESRNF